MSQAFRGADPQTCRVGTLTDTCFRAVFVRDQPTSLTKVRGSPGGDLKQAST